jgi:hypothetical protein
MSKRERPVRTGAFRGIEALRIWQFDLTFWKLSLSDIQLEYKAVGGIGDERRLPRHSDGSGGAWDMAGDRVYVAT